MNYNSGAYNQPVNYLGIPFGNYNSGAYNQPVNYNITNFRFIKNREKDLYVDQGSEYSSVHIIKDETGTPVDLTNCEFQTNISQYSQTAITPINVLIMEAKSGKILINIPENLSSSLNHSRYVYDVKLTNDYTIFRVQSGQILVNNR